MFKARWLAMGMCGLFSPVGLGAIDAVAGASGATLRSTYANAAALAQLPVDMTLADAIYLGLRGNRSIRSAYLQRVTQKYDLLVAEHAFNPKLQLKANYRNTSGSPGSESNTSLTPGASLLGEHGTRLSLSWAQQLNDGQPTGRHRSDGVNLAIIQPLARGAGWEVTTAPVRLARLAEQAQRLALKAGVAQTVSEIISSYRELLRAQEHLAITQAALDRATALLETNNALIAAGRMAQFEIVQAQADIASRELEAEQAQGEVETGRLALLRLLALDLSSPIRASETLTAEPVSLSPPEVLRLAEAQQPEYLSMLLASQQADLNLILAKDQSRWDVSLVAGLNQVRDNYTGSAGNMGGRAWDSYAGLELQIPIADPASRQAEVRAQVGLEAQRVALADAHQALQHSVNDVLRELGTRWRQYEISLRGVELSKRKLAIEKDKLAVGRSSNFQVISYEGDLRTAESARLNALIAYLNAQTRLDLTLGMTLESWDIALNDY